MSCTYMQGIMGLSVWQHGWVRVFPRVLSSLERQRKAII